LLASSGVLPEQIESFLRERERKEMHVPSNNIAKEETQSSIAARDEHRSIEALHVASSNDQVLRKTMGQEAGVGKQRDSRRTREFDNTIAIGELKEKVPRLGSLAQESKSVDSVQVPGAADENCGYYASVQPSAVAAEMSSLLPTVSDCFYRAPLTSGSLTVDDSTLEMSCENAASIISSMRGNGDREQARSQLGCKSREYCNVKNMKVLQLMEME
jgi:hypothetical protein